MPVSLRRLWICGSTKVLNWIDHADIETICVAYDKGCASTVAVCADMRQLSARPAVQIDVAHSSVVFWDGTKTDADPLTFRTYDATHRCRVYKDVPRKSLFRLPAGLFVYVTTLSLRRLRVFDDEPMPPMPALKHLEIEMRGLRLDDELGNFCPLGPRLHCPALEKLMLAVDVADSRRFPASIIISFLTTQLGRGADRLGLLAVRGAVLSDGDMNKLRALVHHLDMDASAAPALPWVDAVGFGSAWGPELVEPPEFVRADGPQHLSP